MAKLLLFVLFSITTKAIPLNEQNIKALEPGSTVGVFSATFDPLTYDHMKLIDAALASGHFSHILVTPVDFNLLKLGATYIQLRKAFVEAAYQDHKRVFYSAKNTKNAIWFLRSKGFNTMSMVLLPDLKGMIGPLKRIGIGLKQPVDCWLVVAETEKQFKNFPFTAIFTDRTLLEHPIPPSSSDVRKFFRKKRPALEYLAELDAAKKLPVPASIAKIILDHDLYYPKVGEFLPSEEKE